MKTAVVKSSTLATAQRWDAKYNMALVEYLQENGLEETPENVETARLAIRSRDTAAVEAARSLRIEAGEILGRARELDQSAELTYPPRNRP
jgi:hypothetical protein